MNKRGKDTGIANFFYKKTHEHHMKTQHPDPKTAVYYYCHLCRDAGKVFRRTEKGKVKSHLDNFHKLSKREFPCTFDDCDSVFKNNSALQQHLKYHKKDWIYCNGIFPDGTPCSHKSICNGDLKLHQSYKHNINVTEFSCDICTSIFKKNADLKRHYEAMHDIGDYLCDFCCKNRNTRKPYSDEYGNHSICRSCYNKVTGEPTRVEEVMSDFLDSLDCLSNFALGTDNSFKSLGGCQAFRPDKFYTDKNLALHIECDENQHLDTHGNYECDETRIIKCYDEYPVKNYIVIRWNPHNFVYPNIELDPTDSYNKIILTTTGTVSNGSINIMS